MANNVHKYLRITINENGEGVLQFEHFSSEKELSKEQLKILALAQKLGVKIVMGESYTVGQPIPDGAVHQDFLKGGS